MNYIITGSRNSGKTQKALEMLKTHSNAGGIVTPKRFTESIFQGYDVLDIESGIVKPFLIYGESGYKKIGAFWLQEEGFNLAVEAIIRAIYENKTIMIDELGQAELAEDVFYNAMSLILNTHLKFVFVIRKSLLESFIKKFKALEVCEIIDMDL